MDAGSEYGVRFPRKTIFSLNTGFEKVEYLVFGFKILNIDLIVLNWIPNDRKLDAGSEYGVRFPRKTIFSLNTRFKKVEYLVLLGVGGNRQF